MRKQREALDEARHAHQEAVYQARSAEAKIRDVEESDPHADRAERCARVDPRVGGKGACRVRRRRHGRSQLQDALKLRGEREQALAAARDALGATETQLKEVEQERFAAEQRLEPAARARERDAA